MEVEPYLTLCVVPQQAELRSKLNTMATPLGTSCISHAYDANGLPNPP